MYGLSPDPSVASAQELGLTPVMTLSAPLTSVKVIEEGTPASYGGTWQAPSRRWVGLVPLGYGDGILRAASNGAPVAVETDSGLVKAHIVGRICMDQFIIDLGPAEGQEGTATQDSGSAPAQVGDRAVLFGDPAKGYPIADEWAAHAGTINYEVITRLGERIPQAVRERRGIMTQIQQYSYRVSDAEQTRELGEQLAHHLRAGDLIMLRGGLGAGKTTFTQGIGRGLQVRGTVASPTFIVARVHPSLVGGPDLIHADAYRIRDLDDLETLDLDSTIDQAVTVVEWGEGKTEAMSDARLEIEVRRASGGEAARDGDVVDLESMDDGQRIITFTPYSHRWDGVFDDLAPQLRASVE